jgi:hypothetical protein
LQDHKRDVTPNGQQPAQFGVGRHCCRFALTVVDLEVEFDQKDKRV